MQAEEEPWCSQAPRSDRSPGASSPRPEELPEQLTPKEAEGSCLGGALHPLQDTLPRSLQESRMVEQTRVIHPLRQEKEASLCQSWAEAATLEEAEGPLCYGRHAPQAGGEWRRGGLRQELGVCQGCHQSQPGQPKGCTERRSLDFLQQQCQELKDQLFSYEEVTQELELSQQQERDRHRQEQLAQAKHRVSLLENMLGLYQRKYQASLGRAGELESQRQQLAEELASQAREMEEVAFKRRTEQLSLQEELRSSCHQVTRAEDAIAHLLQEVRGAQEELAQGQHLTSQYEETIQELQEQLATSHTKVLDQEEALAALHEDFTAYKAAHAFSNSCYESQAVDAQTLRQKLLQAEGESAEHQQRAEEYQTLVQDLKQELARMAEQKHRATEEVARLELAVQSLRLEQERQQLAAAKEQQRGQLLEAEVQQSRELCAQKDQAIQKRDEVLRKSQLEMVQAHSALQEKGQEAAQQRAVAQQLETSLQSTQAELRQSQRECASWRTEAQALQHSLQESREQEQRTAQELAQQKELVLHAQSSLCRAQEELSRCVTEGLHHVQASQRKEAELWVLKDRVASAEAELEQKRVLLEQLTKELSQSKQHHQAAVQEAKQHRQTASQLERKLESNRERLKGLQQRWQEEQQKAQSLQASLLEQEAENQVLREQLKEHTTQLEVARVNLEHFRLQLQQQAAEVQQQEATLSQLHSELHAAQERERQRAHTLATAKDLAQDLEQQVASCQASQREALEQLEERGREVCRLRADLQLSRHKEAHLEEEIQQLRSRLQALQRQQEEEAHRSEERLGKLDREGRHWQKQLRAAEQALADKDEELVVLKVELATLEEKWHTATGKVKTLQTSLEGERAITQRLHQENELMVGNVSQWVKEQKQAKEKLGHKIQEQIKQMAQLTGERDHLQGLTERLQQENKQLKSKVDELCIEQERFKALRCSAWDPRGGKRQPRLGKDPPPGPGQRQSQALATQWHLA